MKRALPVAAALALALLPAIGCRQALDERPTVAARRATFTKTLTLTGTVAAKQTLSLQSPTQGKLNFVAAEGAVVRQGDVVFALDTKDMQRALDSAKIDVTVARSALQKAQEEIRTEKVKNELSLRENAAQLEHARLDLTRATDELEKKKRQVASHITPAAEIPAAELQLEQSRLQLENAQIALERLNEEIASRAQTLELDRQAAQARMDKAQAQMDEAQDFLAKSNVTAPRDGVIVHVRGWRGQEWKAGDEVWQRQPVLELPDLSVMEVTLQVNEADIADVKPGVTARVSFDAWPDLALSGKVEEVTGVAKELRDRDGKGTGVRAFDATVALDAQDARLRPGMTARVELKLDERPDVLVVPVAAVRRDGARTFVVTASGEERDVEVATASADLAVIAKGLAEGDAVRVGSRESPGGGSGASAPGGPSPAPSGPPAVPAADAASGG